MVRLTGRHADGAGDVVIGKLLGQHINERTRGTHSAKGIVVVEDGRETCGNE
jgi:hypothetical protein